MSKPINKWEKPFHVERGDVYMGAVNLDSDPQALPCRAGRCVYGGGQSGL